MAGPDFDYRREIAKRLAKFKHDPLGFVKWAWRWGVAGTTLADESGPREWQASILDEIGRTLRQGGDLGPILQAVASGHGIGKSALVSWLVLWALATRADTKVVVTANTGDQLKTKTWPELAKWHASMLCSEMFIFTATSLFSADPDHEKTWRADAITWSEHNTEAFAGLHNKGRRILLVMDEASGIADKVWEVAEGALTDEKTEIIWTAFGNPTRPGGRFFDCFSRLAHRWNHRQIDSRTVPGTSREQIAKWIEDYGEDSDFVRVRVRGVFPRAGSNQLIPGDVVLTACKAQAQYEIGAACVVGVDVARFGKDESCIFVRRGRDARTYALQRFRGIDTMALSGHVTSVCEDLRRRGMPVDMIFVDATGVGGGVVDRLRQLGYIVTGVNNGANSDVPIEGITIAKRRGKGAECWVRMREWLRDGGAIDAKETDLHRQLESREYFYDQFNGIQLESKDDMTESPDLADALALTFAYPVQPKAFRQDTLPGTRNAGNRAETEYDPWKDLR